MGASHSSSLTSTSPSSIDPSLEQMDLSQNLPEYVMEQRLYPGSGRMTKTFRLRNARFGSFAVVKTMYVSKGHVLDKEEEELRRIKAALQDQPHVAPFLFWKAGQEDRSTSNWRPIYLLRTHVYTTLSDKLASRPFLAQVEKLWIVRQILKALQFVHDSNVVHGFVTSENIGLTSWNHVILMDFCFYKKPTLPDDDPSDYLYYYQEQSKHSSSDAAATTTTELREKRCYIAPERFYTPKKGGNTGERVTNFTPECDVYSAGCVMMETLLNGERAFDLGDLMEYRKKSALPTVVKNKLNKIESSALRAACRHMLHLDPQQRLSAGDYLKRLEASSSSTTTATGEIMPPTFDLYATLFQAMVISPEKTVVTPDARMAMAAAYYGKVLFECMGVTDVEGQEYFSNALGSTMSSFLETKINSIQDELDGVSDDEKEEENDIGRLLAETHDLLEKLECTTQESDNVQDTVLLPPTSGTVKHQGTPTSPAAANSLLLFLQLVLATIRHVQRPSSKLVGLQLLQRLGRYSTDDARLQRIVPTTIVLLHDQDALVRAFAMKVLTKTLCMVQSFAPSDSKVFSQYVFKRVSQFITDPSLVVRVSFSECIPLLAETALRFLDISHAVRLYEVVGGGASTSNRDAANTDKKTVASNVFADDVAKLLGGETKNAITENTEKVTLDGTKVTGTSPLPLSVGKTLISSTYNAELSALHETVSRWVVHITTDQSEQSSPPKLGLLRDLPRLCNFFGRDGVIAFILPQILAFLNDRRDWLLRAALFETLPSVCYIIGRAATEHFVLPCLETALVDGDEQVMTQALLCLASLVQFGLLSHSALVGTPASFLSEDGQRRSGSSIHSQNGLFEKYSPLLLYPSAHVRHAAVKLVIASCQALGFPDRDVFLVPLLRPFLRFEPSVHHLTTPEGLVSCLVPPWTKKMLRDELDQLSKLQGFSPTTGKWTSIGIDMTDKEGRQENTGDASGNNEIIPPPSAGPSVPGATGQISSYSPHSKGPSNVDQVVGYLRMLSRSRKLVLDPRSEKQLLKSRLANAIEGSLKLAQHINFPNQKYAGHISTFVPAWYNDLRDFSLEHSSYCSESCTVRSVSTLSKVYGLSLMHSSDAIEVDKASVDASVHSEADFFSDEKRITEDNAREVLASAESKIIEAASAGEWGAEARLDPSNVDTSLLTTKLNGLDVPPLSPNLGVLRERGSSQPISSQRLTGAVSRDVTKERTVDVEWRPKSDALVASSSPTNGHSAPISRLAVSQDNCFFVSGSHDGTCKVWELRQTEDSVGILESSLTYSGHSKGAGHAYPRINDVAIVENSHSVVSGASDGTVHAWRVDVVSTRKQSADAASPTTTDNYETSRVSGSSVIRKIDPDEGEVLAVSHFNTSAASILCFATQKGAVHSWDLRCAREPFVLKHRPDIGYLTSMALGNDRHWMVTGTSRGFLALWDIRFKQIVKLWQHSNASPVNRLATSFSVLPRGHHAATTDARPYVFAACGPNECSMFDIIDGTCRQCFRVIDQSTGYMDPPATSLPFITDIPITSSYHSRSARNRLLPNSFNYVTPSKNGRVTGMVGSIGGHEPRDYLITGGTDCQIRYFDFLSPSKCYTISGGQQRPSFERIDFNYGRLIICRETPQLRLRDIESSKLPRRLQRGLAKPETKHHDSITDLKMIASPMRSLLSCSSDGAIKLWR